MLLGFLKRQYIAHRAADRIEESLDRSIIPAMRLPKNTYLLSRPAHSKSRDNLIGHMRIAYQGIES